MGIFIAWLFVLFVTSALTDLAVVMLSNEQRKVRIAVVALLISLFNAIGVLYFLW